MNKLVSALSRKNNKTLTENNAVTFASTGDYVLDFFVHAPARQGQDNTGLFVDAYGTDARLALKALFYLRDVRGGKGQRQTFRDILDWLYHYNHNVFDQLVPYVADYGRWDDILRYPNSKTVKSVVRNQFIHDVDAEYPSLLAKWLPSENASSETTKELAKAWMKNFAMTPRSYRKYLSVLRERIRIVERDMSSNNWDEIDYSRVPSRAMKLYNKAFLRRDSERFGEFVAQASRGEVKINSSAVYPHEIVSAFLRGNGTKALEAQWNQLPNYFGDEERNVLVIADTSGSMFTPVSNKSSVQAIEVSVGIALYCAERNQGAFHNYVITFNTNSVFHYVKGKTLEQRVREVSKLPWGGSTNISGALENLLNIAVTNGVPEEDMPDNILIISDMEFDNCGRLTNLSNIKAMYEDAGYEVPTITFWNVNSRHNQSPATQTSKGVFLVSGFSSEIIGKVLNAKATNPYELMLEILNSERYSFVDSIEL